MNKKENGLFITIYSDARRYYPNCKGSFRVILKAYMSRPLFRYVFWLRIVSKLKKKKISKYILAPIPWKILKHYEYKLGVHIDTNISIGGGVYVVHGDGVYLNVNSIGKNFTVYQGVTLGADAVNGKPTVKDNVIVYAGAKVFGNIVLNDNCIVGANAVVTHNVRQDEVVAGVPARSIGQRSKE